MEKYDLARLTPEHDAAMAALIRENLKSCHLDIPGTAYFDEALDHLSAYYDRPGRAYYVLLSEGTVIGGAGFAEFDRFPKGCELQKLYLADGVKGRGLGRRLLAFIEDRARETGYRQMYLETHHVLRPAIRLYETAGFTEIDRPADVVHGTMDRFFWKAL